MTIAADRTARFVAFPDSAPALLGAVVLRDVEDLHDADLDLVLADKLADAYDAADVVWDDEPIGVRSWRREPLALPAPVAGTPAGGTYYTPISSNPPFPEEPGRQL